MNNKKRVLIADDEQDICKVLEFLLSGEGYETSSAHDGAEALELLNKSVFDLVITDIKMPGTGGLEVLAEAKRINASLPVVIMTAFASVASAVDAMKRGASDYIVKPFINEEVKIIVRRLMETARLSSENLALRHEVSVYRARSKDFLFRSESMRRVFDVVKNVTQTKSSVLLLGESGTGKTLVAEIIHSGSPRADGPFISINCSAIPETLLESELFGYRKGAFTGANADKKGLITMADGGTLFLDEIGDMPLSLQAKLLKVLESGEVLPLGDTRPRHSDIRLVTATNMEIEKIVRDGKFREDLYYRINVVEITLPPLRDRKDDIPNLAETFLKKYASQNEKLVYSIDPSAMEILIGYAWPGNVRELENVIERAVVVSTGQALSTKDLPDKIKRPESGTSLREMMAGCERDLIESELSRNSGDKEATAKGLSIDLATLYRKMKKLGVSG